MMRRLVLASCLLAGCGGPAFESEAVELEYLDALSNPTPGQFLRRKQLYAEAEERRRAEVAAAEERRRNTPEAKAKAKAITEEKARFAEAFADDQARIAKAVADQVEQVASDRREDQAATALDATYRAAEAEGMTPEAVRAVYRSFLERYPGTRAATAVQGRLNKRARPETSARG